MKLALANDSVGCHGPTHSLRDSKGSLNPGSIKTLGFNDIFTGSEEICWFIDFQHPLECTLIADRAFHGIFEQVSRRQQTAHPWKSLLAGLDWWTTNRTPSTTVATNAIVQVYQYQMRPQICFRATHVSTWIS